MIQVTITKSPQANSAIAQLVDIKIEGHALEAPYGHDIVCAAVSVLYEQLKAFLHGPEVSDDGKTVKLRTITFDSGDKRMIQSFGLMISQLAKQYPDNLKLKLVNTDGGQR
ncbi:ribosomal-processing cysteine protease Prp [Levilactobacillus enshiensis]|uniref:ribosomal-processing cysteine protease Prp n=1 Tax=Levilactobacillus enshiensis TaxID=2590213 RepID=UPI00131B549E|nr:ribosomal-processing cysteine protease Prp [Levilactobacillus enshiensis]